MQVDQSPWLAEGEFPTRARCNPDCPEEALLWTYVGLPDSNGAPMLFPIDYCKRISRRQWDCGVRSPDSTIPGTSIIKYQRPKTTDPHWLTSPGVWVDINDPDREQFDMKEFVGSLPQDAKRQLAEALGFDPTYAVPDDQIVAGFDKQSNPEPQQRYGAVSRDGATVSNEPLPFDPVRRTVTEVLAYLRTADPEEVDRVVAIERHLGQARTGVLKRYKEVGL